MQNLYVFSTGSESSLNQLSEAEKLSIYYHNLFDYPLNFSDLIKWSAGVHSGINNPAPIINYKEGFYFLEGREGLIYKRVLRERTSRRKLKIAKRTGRILSLLPAVRMVAVTGSLAMNNSSDGSDIDLMIVTKKGNLWTTRLLVHLVLQALLIPVRRAGRRDERDKLCLNMWLDEGDVVWRERNLYTAHEIAQIVPLVNKESTYEKFLFKNRWIFKFWPNAVKIVNYKLKTENSSRVLNIFELTAYKLQCLYMKSKVTREVVTPTRALFHPQDWGKVVLSRLSS